MGYVYNMYVRDIWPIYTVYTYLRYPAALRYQKIEKMLGDGGCLRFFTARSDYSTKVYPELARDICTQFMATKLQLIHGETEVLNILNPWDSWVSFFGKTDGEILLRPGRLGTGSGNDWRRSCKCRDDLILQSTWRFRAIPLDLTDLLPPWMKVLSDGHSKREIGRFQIHGSPKGPSRWSVLLKPMVKIC